MTEMNMDETWGRPDDAVTPSDLEVIAMLHEVAGEVPLGTVDWEAMHRCIVGDAAGLLWQRQRRPWLTWMSRWSPVAIPGGIAAGVVALLLLATAPPQHQSNTSAATPATFVTAVAGNTSVQALADGITGTLVGDTLLSRIIHD